MTPATLRRLCERASFKKLMALHRGWEGGRVGGWEGGYGRIGECMEDECVRCVNAWWGRGEKCV